MSTFPEENKEQEEGPCICNECILKLNEKEVNAAIDSYLDQRERSCG